MLRLTLGTNNEDEEAVEIAEPSWATIASWLKKLRPGHIDFIILDSKAGHFVQVIGSPNELAVEFGQKRGEKNVSLVVLGRRALPSIEIVRIHSSDRSDPEMEVGVEVLRHEVLELTDALVIFEWFYRHHVVPDAYLQRDISKQIAPDLE